MLYASLPHTVLRFVPNEIQLSTKWRNNKIWIVFLLFFMSSREREGKNDDNNKYPPNISRRKNYLVPLRDRKFFFFLIRNPNIIYFVLRAICHFFLWRWIKKLKRKENKRIQTKTKPKRNERWLCEQNKKSTAGKKSEMNKNNVLQEKTNIAYHNLNVFVDT